MMRVKNYDYVVGTWEGTWEGELSLMKNNPGEPSVKAAMMV